LDGVHAGQDGHGKQEEIWIPRFPRGLGRGLHHHRSSGGMEGGHGDPKSRGGGDGMGHGVGNVVELQVEEDTAAAIQDGFHDGGALGSEEFEPDFHDRGRFAQGIEKAKRTVRVGNIEGDDDFVLGTIGRFHTMETQMDRITLAAHAKINLSLRILGKRPDGFHELETLMAPIALADTLEIAHASGTSVSLTCNDPEIPDGEGNLCVKAASLFLAESGITHGVTISLMKRIPHGAGLGGGSSDAAAVLSGMNELFDSPLVTEELMILGASLGSDVPFFFHGAPALCLGRGEELAEAPPIPDRNLLLVKPPFPVPTAWAYGKYERFRDPAMPVPPSRERFLGGIPIVNDLEQPVFRKYLLLPVIREALERSPCVECAFMTGSGSTIVASLRPGTSPERISELRGMLSHEFGPSLWMTETSFA